MLKQEIIASEIRKEVDDFEFYDEIEIINWGLETAKARRLAKIVIEQDLKFDERILPYEAIILKNKNKHIVIFYTKDPSGKTVKEKLFGFVLIEKKDGRYYIRAKLYNKIPNIKKLLIELKAKGYKDKGSWNVGFGNRSEIEDQLLSILLRASLIKL